MSKFPEDLRYTASHEWVSVEEDGSVRIGITDHAQGALGDLVFVDLPAVGERVDLGDACAVVESVKAASDIYSPISGEVLSVNEALEDDPGLINTDPYGDGWLYTVEPSDPAEVDDLLDAEAYAEQLEDE
jgi:glycine cleavage system H protein